MSLWFGWPDWMLEGVCRDLSNDEKDSLFFSGSKDSEAKEICQQCPVIEECLAYAIAKPSIGIWGGTTSSERREMKREARSSKSN